MRLDKEMAGDCCQPEMESELQPPFPMAPPMSPMDEPTCEEMDDAPC